MSDITYHKLDLIKQVSKQKVYLFKRLYSKANCFIDLDSIWQSKISIELFNFFLLENAVPAGIPPKFGALNWRIGDSEKPTRKRKSKENAPKPPSVLTSDAYIEIETKKAEDQVQQQIAAAERKRLREERARAKEVEEKLKKLRKIDQAEVRRKKLESELAKVIATQKSMNVDVVEQLPNHQSSSATKSPSPSVLNQPLSPSINSLTPAPSPTHGATWSESYLPNPNHYSPLYMPFSYTPPGFSSRNDSLHHLGLQANAISPSQLCTAPYPSPPFNDPPHNLTQFSSHFSPCASPSASLTALHRPFLN